MIHSFFSLALPTSNLWLCMCVIAIITTVRICLSSTFLPLSLPLPITVGRSSSPPSFHHSCFILWPWSLAKNKGVYRFKVDKDSKFVFHRVLMILSYLGIMRLTKWDPKKGPWLSARLSRGRENEVLSMEGTTLLNLLKF